MSTSDDMPSRREAQDEILVEALAAGLSYPRAGDAAMVTGRTVQRRMRDPEFARRVAERRAERVTQVTGLLAEASIEAAEVLRECLHSEHSGDRLRAAQLVLSLAGNFNRSERLAARMAEVEARLEGVAAGAGGEES